MEVEIRTAGALRSCYVALPLHLIEALQSTYKGFLPPFLVLELRPRGNSSSQSWQVAWAGDVSSSQAIEISEKYAECLRLADHSHVYVRARTDVPKAETIAVVPDTEDDWEILELNAQFGEDQILTQVGIVQAGSKFPLWLHGQTVVMFHVISSKPDKLVVKLVPGTEVAVAPKQRKKSLSSNVEHAKDNVERKCWFRKALLRVQELDLGLIKTFLHGDASFGVMPTSLAFVNPKTGIFFSLSNGQPVAFTSVSLGSKRAQSGETEITSEQNQSFLKEIPDRSKVINTRDCGQQVVCQIVFLDKVARGHVMLARSLCCYMDTGPHKWVVLRECSSTILEVSSFMLSPVFFQTSKKESNHQSNGLGLPDVPESENTFENDNKKNDTSANVKDAMDWTEHQKLVSSCESENSQSKCGVIEAWLSTEASILSECITGDVINSLLIGSPTFLHFEVYAKNAEPGKTNGQPVSYSSTIHRTNICDVMFLLYVVDNDGNVQNGQINVQDTEGMSPETVERLYCIRHHMPNHSHKVMFGKPVQILSGKESFFDGSNGPSLSSLTWMETAASEALNRLTLILSPKVTRIFSHLRSPDPGHVLLHGPAASGKTQLALALAQHLKEDPEILAHNVILRCSALVGEQTESLKKFLLRSISEAMEHAPSIIVLDDLDHAISNSSGSDGPEPSASMIGLAEYLADLMDAFKDIGRRTCGIGHVAFLGVVKSPGALPGILCSSGRFDFHVQVSPPAVKERTAILDYHIVKHGLQCSENVVSDVALRCDGYDTYDLGILVERAVHAANMRTLSSMSIKGINGGEHKKLELLKEDLMKALEDFAPSAMKGIAKSGSEIGHLGWEDVGGLFETRTAIREILELPVKFSEIFASAPLRLRSGVLLYGPPGCGKTHIVGAAASACLLRFISVKGPELLNKYIGASEQAVRDIFAKASAAAPCILFFDEFDSIAPKRGHDNTGVTDRVVNQFLTELDGVEALTGVFVFAATSRPDLLDAALLRPGRLDRLLFCDFPSAQERLEILEVLSKKLPLASDVDLGIIASNTDGFSGADLQALLSDAQLESVNQHLKRDAESPTKPIVTNEILKSVLAKARPSISEKERDRLYEIYSEFQGARSFSMKSREAKGKRATLA